MTFLAGQTGTAAAFNAALTSITPLTVYKAADESVLNSTTLQDDNELFLSVAANANYQVEAWLHVLSSSQTPDIKLDFTVPTGATLQRSMWGQATGATTGAGSIDTGVATAASTADPRGLVGGSLSLLVNGILNVGSTAGTVRLRFAQNTLDAVASATVKAGSWMRLTPIP